MDLVEGRGGRTGSVSAAWGDAVVVPSSVAFSGCAGTGLWVGAGDVGALGDVMLLVSVWTRWTSTVVRWRIGTRMEPAAATAHARAGCRAGDQDSRATQR